MDSINQQQPEDNHQDLDGQPAIEKMKHFCEKIKTCFFITKPSHPEKIDARPMSIQKVDDQGVIWFLSASDSRKNAALAEDPSVKLYFRVLPIQIFWRWKEWPPYVHGKDIIGIPNMAGWWLLQNKLQGRSLAKHWMTLSRES